MLDVEFTECPAPIIYDVAFVPFDSAAAAIPLGELNVGFAGISEGGYDLPGGVYAGMFTFTCGGTTQFATGLVKPARSSQRYDVGLEPASLVLEGLAAFPAGDDPLRSGTVTVNFGVPFGTPDVTVELRGAVANTTYTLRSCTGFESSLAECALVGSLTTDSRGNVQAALTLPTGSYFGAFVLTRTVGTSELAQFITAFRVNGK